MVGLNRSLAYKQRLQNLRERVESTERRARTRTLIQLGGLMSVLGLPHYIGIEEGEDLQLDLQASDKAATLLGMLSKIMYNLPDSPESSQLESWKEAGIRLLKRQQAFKEGPIK